MSTNGSVSLRDIIGDDAYNEMFPEGKMPVFTPGTIYLEGLDTLMYVERNCSYTERQVGRGMSVMVDPSTNDIVGVQLHGFSQIAKKHALELT